MNGPANLALSDEELQLVKNSEWILTKRVVMDKAVALLGELAAGLQDIIAARKEHLPPAVTGSTPKISKGENYRGLPYAILDYPRYFSGENILAFRCMFWWGNFFSMTLHVSGDGKALFRERLTDQLMTLTNSNGYLYTGDDPWEHHFENGKHVPLTEITPKDKDRLSAPDQWVKIVHRYPLEQWEYFPAVALEQAAVWLKLMED